MIDNESKADKSKVADAEDKAEMGDIEDSNDLTEAEGSKGTEAVHNESKKAKRVKYEMQKKVNRAKLQKW